MPTQEQLEANDFQVGNVTQAYRRNAYVKVYVDGGSGYSDVTDKMEPYLISVEVVSKLLGTSTCAIELDDRDGRLAIPAPDAGIVIVFGWQGEGPKIPGTPMIPTPPPTKPKGQKNKVLKKNIGTREELPWEQSNQVPVFQGQVSNCESGFSRRGGGRRLWIEGIAANLFGAAKTPTSKHIGEGEPPTGGGGQSGLTMIPFATAAQKFFEQTGYSMQVSPTLGKLERAYWSMTNETPHNWAQRMATEFGGVFQVSGTNAAIIDDSAGVNAQGQAVDSHDAVWASNLISWRIKPYSAKPNYVGAAVKFFDKQEGVHNMINTALGGALGGVTAIAGIPQSAPNAQVGEQLNAGTNKTTQKNRGTGWVIINGEPTVVAGQFLNIRGARPGVDGKYQIDEAAHLYSRGGGYTTRCNVINPLGSADTGGT
jgi:hypothetical protein